MDEFITELYVEVYWHLFRIFKNENVAAAVDLFLLSAFQLLNIYAVTVIVQKILSIDVIGYFLHKPLIILFFCGVIFIINFFVSKGAKKILGKENIEALIRRRFTLYVILSIALLVICRLIPK